MAPPAHFPLPNVDVIVVGAGAAGLYTALCLPPSLPVALITKDTLSLSASDWAQGGIAAVIDPTDSQALHMADTLTAGAGLCDQPAVQHLVENAPTCIQTLLDMGVAFDRSGDQLALTLEAAHSRRRVLHAADTTGRALVSTLVQQVLSRPNIHVLAPALVLDLWLDASGQSCQGVCLAYQGRIDWLAASAVILATGGGGQVFAQTTNPTVSTGDGVAIAHRAGAILRDLEFVQFHPTALTKPGAPHFLISEAVRGEGAHLIDKHGRRFTFDYHAAGELAPRDVVSRAIFSHLQNTATDLAQAHVWLDLRPIPPEKIKARFPNIIDVCQRWGIDVFQEPIPVAPAAHYWMGGVQADLLNRCTIAGLYAVGETASTGVHGANRLASNSLLECLVFGGQFQSFDPAALPVSTSCSDSPAPLPGPPLQWQLCWQDEAWIQRLRHELPKLIWQSAGICREQATLAAAIAQVETWREDFLKLPASPPLMHLQPQQTVILLGDQGFSQLRSWVELNNLLEIAWLVLKSALFRTESRGGHYRSDYPQTLPAWQTHTLVQGQCWWQAPVLHLGGPRPDESGC